MVEGEVVVVVVVAAEEVRAAAHPLPQGAREHPAIDVQAIPGNKVGLKREWLVDTLG